MSTISLGPFISPIGLTGLEVAGFKDTGFSMEFSGEEFGAVLPLFLKVEAGKPSAIAFENYFVGVDQLPFGIPYRPYNIMVVGQRRFVQLGCLLASMYRQHDVRRSLPKVLEEFAGCLQLDAGFWQRIDSGASLVNRKLAEAGFEVAGLFSYGRTLNVRFAWVLPGDRSTPEVRRCFHAVMIDFRPQTDRSLDEGRWLLPVETIVSYPLACWFKELVGRKPLNALSPAGQQAALKAFKWTKVSMLNAKELKQARLAFIDGHPELAEQPKELARAMRLDGLWTSTTELHIIVKHLRTVEPPCHNIHRRSRVPGTLH